MRLQLSPLLTALLALPRALAYDNGLGRLPIMGWNTWCTDDACGALDVCNEKEVMSVADAIKREGLDALGYSWLNMDDCWSDTERDAEGNLQPDAKRFPSGMKALADYVHSKGLKLGLYTCVGTETCRWGRPGSFDHYEQDAATIAGWEIDFVKADNCHRPGNYTQRELFTRFSTALNATGRPILFSLCNWGGENVQDWGADIAQMFRIQMDHIPFWSWGPQAAGKGFGQGTSEIIEYVATLNTSFVKPFGFMDPDFLETLFPITMNFHNSRTEYTFWALWSAPLLVATDVRNMSDSMRAIITNTDAIAIDQDPLTVPGVRVFNSTEGGQAWTKPLANGDMAIVIYNPAHTAKFITCPLSALGIPPSTSLNLFDIWQQKSVGSVSDTIIADLQPHDVLFLRATIVH